MIIYDKVQYVVLVVRSSSTGLDRYEHREFDKEDNAREYVRRVRSYNFIDLVDISLTRVDVKTKHTTLAI